MTRRLLALLLCGWPIAALAHTSEMLPEFCAEPTVSSIKAGSWSDRSVWSDGSVPGDGAQVEIGHRVVFDLPDSARIVCIAVPVGGTLAWSPAAQTRLKVGTVLVRGGLEIGTPSAPVTGRAEIVILDAPLDTVTDPNRFGTGLLVTDAATVSVYGAPRTPAFVRLSTEPKAGDASLALAAGVTGWQAGDEVVLPDSRYKPVGRQTEYRALQVSPPAGANSVLLSSPLAYAHPGARAYPAAPPELLPHVGNLTRSILFRSENPAGTRGHVFFSKRAKVAVHFARFQDLGRTVVTTAAGNVTYDDQGNPIALPANQNGRYPFHFHRVDGPPPGGHLPSGWQFEAIGNVVVGGPKWGLVIHDSHYGLAEGNIVNRVTGCGAVYEDGTETGSLIRGNFIVDIPGPGVTVTEKLDGEFGKRGCGIWTQTGFGGLVNNVVAAVKDVGIFLNRSGPNAASQGAVTVYLPKWQGADTTAGEVMPKSSRGAPIPDTRGNEVYNAGGGGFETWRMNYNEPVDAQSPNAIRDSTLWHNPVGLALVTSTAILVDGATIRGGGSGIIGNATYAITWMIRRADIRGASVGLRLPGRSAVVEDSVLQNATNVQVNYEKVLGGTASTAFMRRVLFRRVEFLALPTGTVNLAGVDSRGDMKKPIALGPDEVLIEGYRWGGEDLGTVRFFYGYQLPATVWPLTGLTAGQMLAQYGTAPFGEAAPCPARPGVQNGTICPVAARVVPVIQRSGFTTASTSYTLSYQALGSDGVWRSFSKTFTGLVAGKNWLAVDVVLPTGESRKWSGYVVKSP
jgi:hypothetical protein